MLNAIKRWISGQPPTNHWSDIAAWAHKQGYGFRRAREGEGFVIDGTLDGRPWRLEWGPPQRRYIERHELRIRTELQLSSRRQMLLMTLPLMERLEREAFERYTQVNQTLIDLSMPEETRWLAMFPKVELDLPKGVKGMIGAVASNPQNAVAWVDAELAQQLVRVSLGLIAEQPAFVLMTLRGRLYLRLQLEVPDPPSIDEALQLFAAAARSAVRMAGPSHEPSSGWSADDGSTAWQTHLTPEDPKDDGSR